MKSLIQNISVVNTALSISSNNHSTGNKLRYLILCALFFTTLVMTSLTSLFQASLEGYLWIAIPFKLFIWYWATKVAIGFRSALPISLRNWIVIAGVNISYWLIYFVVFGLSSIPAYFIFGAVALYFLVLEPRGLINRWRPKWIPQKPWQGKSFSKWLGAAMVACLSGIIGMLIFGLIIGIFISVPLHSLGLYDNPMVLAAYLIIGLFVLSLYLLRRKLPAFRNVQVLQKLWQKTPWIHGTKRFLDGLLMNQKLGGLFLPIYGVFFVGFLVVLAIGSCWNKVMNDRQTRRKIIIVGIVLLAILITIARTF